MSSVPTFSLSGSRFDMTSYWGRTAYFFKAIDPRLCLETSETLAAHQKRLDDFVQKRGGSTDEQLWEARFAIENCIHPTTKVVIASPFRMAAFIPTNLFIVPFMMLPSTMASVKRTVLIHWFNQSYNCLINYNNRSSESQPMGPLLQAYAAAVGVSVSGALGATMALRKLGTKPSFAVTLVRATLPCCAVAFASSANLACMRRNEWSTEGLPVLDEDGEVRGKSVAAGRDALFRCAAARVLWNIPCMTLPPLLTAPLLRIPLFAAYPVGTESTLVGIGMVTGVAPALAWYPKHVQISAQALEPNFHNLTRKDGTPVRTFTFYKGL